MEFDRLFQRFLHKGIYDVAHVELHALQQFYICFMPEETAEQCVGQ